MISVRIVMICALATTILSCASTNRIAELNKMREMWRIQDVNEYSFSYQIDCFCPEESLKPYRINVTKGMIIKAISLDGETDIPQDLLSRWETIPELFNIIAKAIAKPAYKLSVKYDPMYGYPAEIVIDYKKNIADDYVLYKVWDLQFTK